MKALRVRLGIKQLCFAHAVGCTDAAVSLWETGRRVPGAVHARRVFHAFSSLGASPADVDELQKNWLDVAMGGESSRNGF